MDLREPLGPENIFDSSLPRRSTELQWYMRRRALVMRCISSAPGRPMWLGSFITCHYSDDFEFVNIFFEDVR
jgi:hypothetical protein